MILLLALPLLGAAQSEPSVLGVATQAAGGQSFSLSIQILVMMTLLTLLPAAILSTSAFVRIIIVLSILRQALGTAQTPPNQVLLGVALFLTFFIMSPVLSSIYDDAAKPYMDGNISAEQAFEQGIEPLKRFMLDQTRESDLALFAGIAQRTDIETPEQAPISIIIPGFMVSELKTAFQIGFLVFIPFLVIDLVVSSVLMSMGMMMLSPMLISLPFKIMLFVLVDGWALVLGTLASSFYL
ncbi:MAG: flagellar type III secretion system pore protein FliP [Gammaproteobacteria bacterium]|nr:flagellar type III secretion system pore protein FliP [Gammaproteobacteria bacterium]MDH4313268.1 flagellar type III secretion system pore protein FliP [Gammaproteobacteria bacterium]MDH5212931.1 flagellar type III secretion system pore protein FliP [Gammaproteobacteria bacterium]